MQVYRHRWDLGGGEAETLAQSGLQDGRLGPIHPSGRVMSHLGYMYNFPDSLTVEQLEKAHPDRAGSMELYEVIDDLVEGGWRLRAKAGKYLVKRPSESLATWQHRQQIFTYRPVLGGALNQIMAHFSKGQVQTEGLVPTSIWSKILGNLKGHKSGNVVSQMEFVRELFDRLLKYRIVWALIDRPKDGGLPYIVVPEPGEILSWDEMDGEITFLKTRRIETSLHPWEGPSTRYLWTLIDDQQIATYEYVLKEGEKSPPKWAQANLLLAVEHGHPTGVPAVKIEIPSSMWATNQAVLTVLEKLRLDNGIAFSSEVASIIQRWMKPLKVGADESIDEDVPRTPMGNEVIVVADNVGFASAGSGALADLRALATNLEEAIKDILYNNGVDVKNGSLPSESGVARAFDFANQEAGLRAVGALIIDGLTRLYREIGRSLGLPESLVGAIRCQGLDSFSVNHLIPSESPAESPVNGPDEAQSELGFDQLKDLVDMQALSVPSMLERLGLDSEVEVAKLVEWLKFKQSLSQPGPDSGSVLKSDEELAQMEPAAAIDYLMQTYLYSPIEAEEYLAALSPASEDGPKLEEMTATEVSNA